MRHPVYWEDFCVSSSCHNAYHRLGALNNKHLFPHSSGGQKSEIKVSAGLVSSEGLSPWLVDDILLLSHVGFPLCLSVA